MTATTRPSRLPKPAGSSAGSRPHNPSSAATMAAPIGVDVLAAPIHVPGETPYVPLLVEIDGASLIAGQDGGVAQIELFRLRLRRRRRRARLRQPDPRARSCQGRRRVEAKWCQVLRSSRPPAGLVLGAGSRSQRPTPGARPCGGSPWSCPSSPARMLPCCHRWSPKPRASGSWFVRPRPVSASGAVPVHGRWSALHSRL